MDANKGMRTGAAIFDLPVFDSVQHSRSFASIRGYFFPPGFNQRLLGK